MITHRIDLGNGKEMQLEDWGISKEQLEELIYVHRIADKKTKEGIEDALEDINFHTECGYLSEGKYKEAYECLKEFDE
jgi:hypothetical protein